MSPAAGFLSMLAALSSTAGCAPAEAGAGEVMPVLPNAEVAPKSASADLRGSRHDLEASSVSVPPISNPVSIERTDSAAVVGDVEPRIAGIPVQRRIQVADGLRSKLALCHSHTPRAAVRVGSLRRNNSESVADSATNSPVEHTSMPMQTVSLYTVPPAASVAPPQVFASAANTSANDVETGAGEINQANTAPWTAFSGHYDGSRINNAMTPAQQEPAERANQSSMKAAPDLVDAKRSEYVEGTGADFSKHQDWASQLNSANASVHVQHVHATVDNEKAARRPIAEGANGVANANGTAPSPPLAHSQTIDLHFDTFPELAFQPLQPASSSSPYAALGNDLPPSTAEFATTSHQDLTVIGPQPVTIGRMQVSTQMGQPRQEGSDAGFTPDVPPIGATARPMQASGRGRVIGDTNKESLKRIGSPQRLGAMSLEQNVVGATSTSSEQRDHSNDPGQQDPSAPPSPSAHVGEQSNNSQPGSGDAFVAPNPAGSAMPVKAELASHGVMNSSSSRSSRRALEQDGTLPQAASLSGLTLNTAKVLDRAGKTEMRIAMHSAELGEIAIRTSLVKHGVDAEIYVQHSEVGTMLTSELPSLQARLSEQHISVGSIVVQNHNGALSSSTQENDHPHHHSGAPQVSHNVGVRKSDFPQANATAEYSGSEYRLDIRI